MLELCSALGSDVQRMKEKKITNFKEKSKKIISDQILKKQVKILIERVNVATKAMDKDFERNVIDPFAYLFQTILFKKKDHKDWKLSELSRQIEKAFSNALGEFHQNLLCSLNGCIRPVGGVDFMCEGKKIVAEIKNKHNSINFTSKAGSFDKIKYELSKSNRKDFKGYFVTIIPKKNNKNYEEVFTITKNKTKSEYRDSQENIFTISAENFYEKITGKKDILKSIYQRLPEIFLSIDSNKYKNINKINEEKFFNYYLLKALKD